VEDELDAVLALDPGLLTAREGLARARSRRADALLAEGDTRLAADDLPGALALWRKSHALSPGESSERRLQVAEAQRCLTLGIQYYEAQRLPEAVFHLKKALALDPDNAQAERYLAYANGRTSDSQLADRFSRLE
jgi:tetratricopeptide (TPR) repeat protein